MNSCLAISFLVKKKWERVLCHCHSISSQHSKMQKCVKLDGHSKDYLSFFWQICRCLRELQVEFRNPPVSASLLLGHRVQLHFDLITFFSSGLGSEKSNKNNCISDRLKQEKKIEAPIFDLFKWDVPLRRGNADDVEVFRKDSYGLGDLFWPKVTAWLKKGRFEISRS